MQIGKKWYPVSNYQHLSESIPDFTYQVFSRDEYYILPVSSGLKEKAHFAICVKLGGLLGNIMVRSDYVFEGGVRLMYPDLTVFAIRIADGGIAFGVYLIHLNQYEYPGKVLPFPDTYKLKSDSMRIPKRGSVFSLDRSPYFSGVLWSIFDSFSRNPIH
jgi:hypothetical protein